MNSIFIRSKKRSYGTVRSGEYDFNKDAGAIGTFNTGVYIPAFAVVKRFYVKPIVTVTSGGAATISFGFAGSVQALMVTTGFAAFVAGAVPIAALTGVDFNANPTVFNVTQGQAPEIIMTIATAALTAGRFAFSIEFDEFDF